MVNDDEEEEAEAAYKKEEDEEAADAASSPKVASFFVSKGKNDGHVIMAKVVAALNDEGCTNQLENHKCNLVAL